jgi:hypothetical protein
LRLAPVAHFPASSVPYVNASTRKHAALTQGQHHLEASPRGATRPCSTVRCLRTRMDVKFLTIAGTLPARCMARPQRSQLRPVINCRPVKSADRSARQAHVCKIWRGKYQHMEIAVACRSVAVRAADSKYFDLNVRLPSFLVHPRTRPVPRRDIRGRPSREAMFSQPSDPGAASMADGAGARGPQPSEANQGRARGFARCCSQSSACPARPERLRKPCYELAWSGADMLGAPSLAVAVASGCIAACSVARSIYPRPIACA